MCRCSRTIIFLNILLAKCAFSAPNLSKMDSKKSPSSDMDRSLDEFLSVYYDQFVHKPEKTPAPEDDIYETMQGDQAPIGNNINQNLDSYSRNGTGEVGNFTQVEYVRAMRDRSKENWIQILKENILRHVGRQNSTTTILKPEDVRLHSLNMSEILPHVLNSSNLLNDDQVLEKIRSFYPSCEIPGNTDQDLWKDDDVMNLYFNDDYTTENRNANIATATLRLYRIPENGTKLNAKSIDCNNSDATEDEKLLRISVYWYTKSLKKRRAKRRLSDSKMVPENSKWVELSVKPATKAWSRGKNLGLGVLVEDQEGNTLRASRYFKGASCTVGASTPKPIPTIIIDAARQNNELNRLHNLLGKNSTAALHSDIYLLPTIDICTLEFPENFSQSAHWMSLRTNACNLRALHEESQRLAERERLDRIVSLPDILVPSPRHIRHHRQYLVNKMNEEGVSRDFDIRSRILGSKVIISHDELQNFTNAKSNFSTINR